MKISIENKYVTFEKHNPIVPVPQQISIIVELSFGFDKSMAFWYNISAAFVLTFFKKIFKISWYKQCSILN